MSCCGQLKTKEDWKQKLQYKCNTFVGNNQREKDKVMVNNIFVHFRIHSSCPGCLAQRKLSPPPPCKQLLFPPRASSSFSSPQKTSLSVACVPLRAPRSARTCHRNSRVSLTAPSSPSKLLPIVFMSHLFYCLRKRLRLSISDR